MNFGWQFDRGKYQPEVGSTPVKVKIVLGDEAAQTTIEAIITDEAAKAMLADLQKVASGLDVVAAIPTNGAGS